MDPQFLAPLIPIVAIIAVAAVKIARLLFQRTVEMWIKPDAPIGQFQGLFGTFVNQGDIVIWGSLNACRWIARQAPHSGAVALSTGSTPGSARPITRRASPSPVTAEASLESSTLTAPTDVAPMSSGQVRTPVINRALRNLHQPQTCELLTGHGMQSDVAGDQDAALTRQHQAGGHPRADPPGRGAPPRAR